MKNQELTASQAIEESILRNEIVHISCNKQEYEKLIRCCKDYVECDDCIDFWGDDGENKWRVQIDI